VWRDRLIATAEKQCFRPYALHCAGSFMKAGGNDRQFDVGEEGELGGDGEVCPHAEEGARGLSGRRGDMPRVQLGSLMPLARSSFVGGSRGTWRKGWRWRGGIMARMLGQGTVQWTVHLVAVDSQGTASVEQRKGRRWRRGGVTWIEAKWGESGRVGRCTRMVAGEKRQKGRQRCSLPGGS
jgi:hypothetical protein